MSKQAGSLFKNAPLACPNCEETNLHPQSINVYWRERDRVESGIKTEISAGVAAVKTNMDGNPSKHGNGIVIIFNCETCDYASKIVIAEQAGETFFAME